jgi:hypothetical protein
MTFALDAITHISSINGVSTANSATSHQQNSRRSTTLEPEPNIKPQHPPGPDAKDRPVQTSSPFRYRPTCQGFLPAAVLEKPQP